MLYYFSFQQWLQKKLFNVEIPTREYFPPPRSLQSKEFAAVTCYFNPTGSLMRKNNFKLFLKSLQEKTPQLQILVVELAFGDEPFEWQDIPGVLQVRGGDILWQKERLLNLGIQKLIADGYGKIAWLDADIILEDPYWPERTAIALDQLVLCQLFSESVRHEGKERSSYVRKGVVARFLESGKITLTGLSAGYAWAARADLLKKIPLYDKGIVGGGDALIWLASLCCSKTPHWEKRARRVKLLRKMGTALRKHYFAWATQFGQEVDARIGRIEQTVHSLYHGDAKHRHYGTRYQPIQAYDPTRDIELSPQGVWIWSTVAKLGSLPGKVRSYFIERREK